MTDEKKVNAKGCSVTHIRRVDITEKSESTGNGDDCYTDTEEKVALDIVEQNGQLYVVLTESHYSHSYDQYESPMNTYSERTSFKICTLGEEKKDGDKETLLEHIKCAEIIFGSYDYAGDPEKSFVAAQVERALKKHADEARIAEQKKKGECELNAIYITSIGKVFGVYIDDFSTNEGLATALGCDAVTVCRKASEPEIGYFHNAKRRSGIILNRLVSAFLGENLDGDVVICAIDQDGNPAPFSEEDLLHMLNQLTGIKRLRNL